MRRGTAQAPPAQLILGGHAPAPAWVEFVYQPLPGRLLRALGSLVLFWGSVPYLVWVPPHYPWVLAAFAAGLYLPYYFWSRKYRVRSFAGACPRCSRALALPAGVKINLPHTLTCYGCHFESVLEVGLRGRNLTYSGHQPPRAEHRDSECVGVWTLYWVMDQQWAVCRGCGARCYATPEVRRMVEEENEHERMLRQLTLEGRFLL